MIEQNIRLQGGLFSFSYGAY